MKLESQVCTWDQSTALQALGVYNMGTFFFVRNVSGAGIITCIFTDIATALKQWNQWTRCDAHMGAETSDVLAAWTDAELSIMLPGEFKQPTDLTPVRICTYLENGLWRCSVHRPELLKQTFTTEAQARAALLIWLLQNNHIDVADVNRRLQTA